MNLYNPDGSASKEFILNRLVHKYKFLFPLNLPKDDLDYVFEKVEKLDPTKDVLFVSPSNYMKPSFLGLLLKTKEYIELKYFDLFSLTELWLGKNEDTSSLSAVRDRHMCIYFSNRDLPNKNHQDVLLYVLNRSIRDAKSTRWLFYQGSEQDLKTSFPSLLHLVATNELSYVLIPTRYNKQSAINKLQGEGSKTGAYHFK